MEIPPVSSTSPLEDIGATKIRLLDASERLFAERGFAGASVRDIAEASGCNLAAMNYHFSSKEKLYQEVMLRRMRQLREKRVGVLSELMERFPDGTKLEEVLRGYAEAFLRSQREPDTARRLLQLFAREFLDPRLPAGTFQQELMQPIESLLAEAIRRARPDLDDAVARLCVHSLLAQLVYLAHLPRAHGAAEGPDEAAMDALVDHVTRLTTAGVAGYRAPEAAPGA